MILSYALILPVSQLRTQQIMTSLISSHIEYLIQTSYYFAHFVVEIDEKSSFIGGFYYDFMMIRDSGLLFLGHPVVYLHIRSNVLSRFVTSVLRHMWNKLDTKREDPSSPKSLRENLPN